MPFRFIGLAREWLRAKKGAVAIEVALLMTVLLGTVALGTEISLLIYKHKQMQSAADSAALGGATALGQGYPADPAVEARAIAATVGYPDGVDGVAVAVNHPPLSGPHAGDSSAVEVIVAQPQTLGMVSLFRSGLFDVGARAVATQGSGGPICILALDPTASVALLIDNNSTVLNKNCGVGVNSSSNSALYLNNNAHIAGPVSVVGNWFLGPNASLDFKPAPVPHQESIPDPYASVPSDSEFRPDCALLMLSSCLSPCLLPCTAPNGATVNLKPGYYKAGWNYPNNQTLNLVPGTYYIGGQLNIGNRVTVNGTGGVTIVIAGNYAISLMNNATLNITAPTTSTAATPYPGLAIVDLSTTTNIIQTFPNGTIMNITGAIYFPHQTIQFNNNGSVPGSDGCTQLIGRVIKVANNLYLNGNCGGTGAVQIGVGAQSRLVE